MIFMFIDILELVFTIVCFLFVPFFPMLFFFCLPLKFFTYSIPFLLLVLQDPIQVSWLVTELVLEITATHCWRLGWRWDVAFLKGFRFAYDGGDETGRWWRSWLMDSEIFFFFNWETRMSDGTRGVESESVRWMKS